jgi:hypothetical protein
MSACVGTTVVKYALNTFCNKHVSVITLTVYATLVPVLTAVLSAVFLQVRVRVSFQRPSRSRRSPSLNGSSARTCDLSVGERRNARAYSPQKRPVLPRLQPRIPAWC